MTDTRESQNTSLPAGLSPPSIFSADVLAFLDILPDGLVIVNQAGSIVLVNSQTEVIFGYAPGGLVGQQLEVLLPQRFRAVHNTHQERYFSAPAMRQMGVGLQLVGRRSNGSEFPVEISLNPLLLDGIPYTLGAIRDVSAQRAAESERLLQSQQIRLQAELINHAHDAILVRDSVNRVLSWNKGAEELYGWTAQEALGRVSHTLLKTRFSVDLVDVEAHLENCGQWQGELVHTCRNGRVVTVESQQVLVGSRDGQPTAILEIDRDITMRREIEETAHTVYTETKTRLSFMQQVLDALPCSVSLVYGQEARLVLANHASASVWGAKWQTDQPMLEFLSSNGIELCESRGLPLRPEQYATLRAVQQGEIVLQQQQTIHRPHDVPLPVLVSALPLPPQQGSGQLVPQGEALALVVHQDVTPLKEAEYLKDEFVGIVAHELRTPLAALRGFAEMLLVQTARQRGPQLANWQQEALEEIEVATRRLTKLTEDLLDVTRLQTGRLLLQRTRTNVVSLTRRVAAFLQQATTLHQVEVHSAQVELKADVDPVRIEQVMTNLISNAIKYSPHGGPVIITVWEEKIASRIVISVQDHGIGIPDAQQAHMFGRFIRADNARAWGITGSGLGLYICRELVQRHGGHLWFESEEGTGSTFYLTLPAIPDATHPARPLISRETSKPI